VSEKEAREQQAAPVGDPAQVDADVDGAVDGEGDLWHALDSCFTTEAVDRTDSPVKTAIASHLKGSPVSALRLSTRHRVAIAIAGAVAMLAILASAGLRSDFSEQPWSIVLGPAILLSVGFIVGVRLFDAHYRGLFDVATLIAVLSVFVVSSLVIQPEAHSMSSADGPVAHGLQCGGMGLIITLSALLPAIVLARRNMAGPTIFGAILIGALCAALGLGTLQLGCGIVDKPHLLLGHGLVFVVGIGAALMLRRVRAFS